MSKTCKNPGCQKQYTDEENSENACLYHSGMPIFRDLSKKWSCCKVETWDWDEFMKVKGCTTGCHRDVPPSRAAPEEANAPIPIAQPIAVQSPIPITPVPTPAVAPVENLTPVVTPAGNYKCCHAGCGIEYSKDDNGEESCKYHSGKPIFRDTRKHWTCCNAGAYDWDDFMKIPTCCVGPHEPKMA